MLVEVVDLLLADRGLDGDRRQRVEAALVDLAGERLRRDVEDVARAAGRARTRPSFGMSPTQSCTAVPATFETTTRPSAIEDRAARRLDANEAELVVLRRVQVAPRPRAPAATRAGRRGRRTRAARTTPRTPTRSASCGVSRCGSRTLGSGGRKRPDGARRSLVRAGRQTNDLDLRGRLAAAAAPRRPRARARRPEARARGSARTPAASAVTSACSRDDLLAEHVVEDVARTRPRAA